MTEPSKERIAAALDVAKAAGVEPGEPYRVLCEALGKPSRVAAALALAEAVEKAFPAAIAQQSDWCAESKEVVQALAAYRATAPRMRTRAEVDAEIVSAAREWAEASGYISQKVCLDRIDALCAEPLAPDPTETGDAELADSVQVKTRSALAEATLAAQLRELRSRLRNIYSLTHTYGTDPMAALLAIREASSPGA